jgi:hypothetical protein
MKDQVHPGLTDKFILKGQKKKLGGNYSSVPRLWETK